jgi:hypothetical protein
VVRVVESMGLENDTEIEEFSGTLVLSVNIVAVAGLEVSCNVRPQP